jgi:hypothetical protein
MSEIDVVAEMTQHQELVAARQIHEPVWRDCFKFTHPLRGQGFDSTVEDTSASQAQKAEQVDSTAPDASLILASEIQSGMTPANTIWFGLAVEGSDEDGRRWLGDCAETLWQNIHMANFDATAFEGCIDAVEAGWFALYVDEDKEQGGFHFDQWPIWQVYCAASKPGGLIDIVHRKYQLTALQCVNEFGEENVSENTRKLAKEKPQEKVCMLHIIKPRQTYAVDAKLSKNLPIASYHIEVDAKKCVRESGYHEMPVVVPRWMNIPGSVYAVGRIYDALPTIKRLNQLCRLELSAADIAVGGMWIAEDDGVLNPRTIRLGAKKVVVANSVESMKELKTGSDFSVGEALRASMQSDIRRILMADALPPIDSGERTAFEFSVRLQALRKLLGPTFGRFQSEYLTPMIERCFGIAFRAGIFTPPPESLAGRTFSVRFIGPLARAQKMEEAIAIQQYVTATLEAAAQMPEIADNCDFDEANRLGGEALGVPSAVIRKKEDRDKLRRDRMAAQQRMQQEQQQQGLATAAGDAMIKRAANQ